MSLFDKLKRSQAIAVSAMVIPLFLFSPTQAKDVLRLGVGEWKPFISESLPHYGPALEVVSRAFEYENIKIEYTFVPWKRAMKLTAKGRFDGTPGWIFSDERAADFRYSDSVFIQKDLIFFHRNKVFKFDSADDFAGMRTRTLIGAHIGDEFAQMVGRGQLTNKESRSYSKMFKMLFNQRIDFLYLGEYTGTSEMKSALSKDQASQIVAKDSFRKPHSYHLLVSRQNENGLRILKAFNRGMQKLRASGDYDRIIGKIYQKSP